MTGDWKAKVLKHQLLWEEMMELHKMLDIDPSEAIILGKDKPCDVCTCPRQPPNEMDEAVGKVKARTALNGRKGKIIIPDREEMLGIHLLDRDDQLRPERKDR